MQTTTEVGRRSIEVTGLPEEAIQALETLVASLRNQENERATYSSYEQWSSALREWVKSHPKSETIADWTRESIYADRSK